MACILSLGKRCNYSDAAKALIWCFSSEFGGREWLGGWWFFGFCYL